MKPGQDEAVPGLLSVSVIIATSGRPEPLSETLRSLGTVGVPEGCCAELLLVENVSRSGAERLLDRSPNDRLAGTRYFFEPRRGKANALNLALQHARGRVFLFTDDDVRFPSDWIERMCRPIWEGRADAVAGGVRFAPHLVRAWMNHTHRAWLASTADYLSPEDPAEMCGANMAVGRHVFEKISGFDPELGPGITGGGEETLLSWQMKAAGFRIVAALDFQVEHHFDAQRLQYESWLKAAEGKGRARAYLLHHWRHEALPSPRIAELYYRAKLGLRRGASARQGPGDEGIAPWELSYVETISTCAEFLRQRGRPRNYSRLGLRRNSA